MTYSAEMKLLALVDREASNSGRIVKATFEMHADDAEALRGKTGKRFGVALAEIGDDEKPMPKPPQNHRVKRAATLCADPMFQKYMAQEWTRGSVGDEQQTAALLRSLLSIGSRSELATNLNAATRFDQIAANFELWKRGE